MRKLLLGLVVFALGIGTAVLVFTPGAGARSLVDGILTGQVGDPDNPDLSVIGLDAPSVAAGTYELDVNDYSSIHNFHFCNEGANAATCAAGAPVDVATSISGSGLTTFVVTLTPGTYVYHCDVHGSMHGTLVVTGSGGTTSTATTTSTTGTTTTNTTTTSTTPVLKVKSFSTTQTRKVVTVKVKASQLTHITAVLIDKKTSTVLATAATDGIAATLKLRSLTKLPRGKYIVKVTVECCGTSATKQKTILVM